MMKIFKRLLLFLLLTLATFIGFTNVNATAINDVTEIGGAKYYVDERKEDNSLSYGVQHYNDKGYSLTNAYGSTDEYNPQNVNVLEVPSNENVKVTSWANLSGHKWTRTTVKVFISDYENKNPGWKVIAAINGDFFDIGAKGNLPYQTSGAVVSNGEHYKTTTSGTTNVGFTNDGSANSLIGHVPVQRTDLMKLAVYDGNDNIIKTFDIDKINTSPNANETAIYYGVYNSDHNYVPVNVSVGDAKGYFVDQAELALPNNANDFYGKGIISSTESKVINKGQFSIVSNNPEVQESLSVGTKIRAQWEFVGEFGKTPDISGSGPKFLDNAQYLADNVANSNLKDTHPRTLIGRKADGTIVMMVVDGRQSGMHGAHGSELAAMMMSYGAVDAYNLDGGGSSTMVIRKNGELIVANSPSDSSERTVSNAILVVAKEPEIEYEVSDLTQDQFTITANLLNNNGHDVKELYIKINGEKHNLTNGKINFTNLQSNTKYSCLFGYVNTEGLDNDLLTHSEITTLKKIPELIKLHIGEVVEGGIEYYTFDIEYIDPDRATSFDSAYLRIGSKGTALLNGKSKIKKSIIPDISSLAIEYTYDIGDRNKVFVAMKNPQFDSTMALNNLIFDQKLVIDSLYK